MIFQATHLEHFPPADAIAQSVLLGLLTAIPIALLVPAWRRRPGNRGAEA